MRILWMVFILVLLGGCDPERRKWTWPETCINGVVYYNTYNRLAPAFNQDSTVKTCEEKED